MVHMQHIYAEQPAAMASRPGDRGRGRSLGCAPGRGFGRAPEAVADTTRSHAALPK